jgi:hypothetical protein
MVTLNSFSNVYNICTTKKLCLSRCITKSIHNTDFNDGAAHNARKIMHMLTESLPSAYRTNMFSNRYELEFSNWKI